MSENESDLSAMGPGEGYANRRQSVGTTPVR
jgi:hypothetical protein